MMKNNYILALMFSVLLSFSGMVLRAQNGHQATPSQEAHHETLTPKTLQATPAPKAHHETPKAQQSREQLLLQKKYTLYFRVNESVLDSAYMGNAQVMGLIANDIQNCLEFKNDSAIQINIVAYASPEGRYTRNVSLSQSRKETIVSFIQKSINVSEVTFSANSFVEDWNMVVDLVKADQNVPHRDEILEAILNFERDPDTNLKANTNPKATTNQKAHTNLKADTYMQLQRKLQNIDNGVAYEYLREHIFPYLRSCKIVAIYDMSRPVAHVKIEEVEAPRYTLQAAPAYLQMPKAPATTPAPALAAPGFTPSLKLKINTIGLGMGHANIAFEVAAAEHVSVAVPFYYSGGFDYLKPTLKFRGIVLQPEVRYYVKGNEGFYIGAHAGIGWYNFALDGELRIQDHRGRRPAYGGGLGLGYALSFRKNPRWGMEFALGAGAYDVKYDVLYNEPNGAYAEHGVHDTFIGIDNASIAFTYRFDFKKEGSR